MTDITLTGARRPGDDDILTTTALDLLVELHRVAEPVRQKLLAARDRRRREIADGASFDFLPDTADVREGDWQVASAAPGLVDRRVEITGPTDRRMTVNALNSGAQVWLADFEDAITPTWGNVVDGQVNLFRAIRGTLDFTLENGKRYAVGDSPATIVVRPRGWHLDERHVLVDGVPVAGGIVDMVLYLSANGTELTARGSGPYFYLPKMESHLEARLWNDLFTRAQAALGIPHGTIRATALIETLPAAFEMEEILYELRDHAAGLNAGRWDYIFSLIKYLWPKGPEAVLPDRSAVTMTVPFMRAYTQLLVRTCHRRGAHAIGGMSAFIPNRRDPAVTETAMAQVRADKDREAGDGFDGSWVAHPDLVPVCREAFDAVLGEAPNQKDRALPTVSISAGDLLDIGSTPGASTFEGLRRNVSVAIRYLAAWLGGTGAVAIDNLMEDAATAEISRSQVWQWVHEGVTLEDGRTVTRDLVDAVLDDVAPASDQGLAAARDLFERTAFGDELVPFFTGVAYADLIDPTLLDTTVRATTAPAS